MLFFSVHTWMGTLLVAAQTQPFGVERIYLPGCAPGPEKSMVSGGFNAGMPGYPQCPPARAVVEMIHAYFNSCRPIAPPWQWLGLERLSPLQQQVLRITAQIPCGQVRSYRDIAVKLGKPGAARFVGNTLAANPWPLLVACHRVVRSSGETGGFGGGSAMKKALLAHESGNKDPVLAH